LLKVALNIITPNPLPYAEHEKDRCYFGWTLTLLSLDHMYCKAHLAWNNNHFLINNTCNYPEFKLAFLGITKPMSELNNTCTCNTLCIFFYL
jgi:hypothetical protein